MVSIFRIKFFEANLWHVPHIYHYFSRKEIFLKKSYHKLPVADSFICDLLSSSFSACSSCLQHSHPLLHNQGYQESSSLFEFGGFGH